MLIKYLDIFKMDRIFIIMCVFSAVWFNVRGSVVIKRSACKEDETFVECAHCGPKSCEELGRPKPCAGSTGLCRPECVCMDGHVRNADGKCILKSQCQCEELVRFKPCAGSTSLCRPECVCMDGHVRNTDGKCILKKPVPLADCGGDRNATSGCGDHCGTSCSDYNDANKTCFSSCQYNRCDCRDGYVFHDSLSVCVLPEDC